MIRTSPRAAEPPRPAGPGLSEARQHALRRLRDAAGARPLPLADVTAALGLEPLPYAWLAGPEAWLAGGRVLRWLCTEQPADGNPGDTDLVCPSLAALDRLSQRLADEGFVLDAYSRRSRTIREYLSRGPRTDRSVGLWEESGRPARLTADLVERLDLLALAFRAPNGDKVHLMLRFHPSPAELLRLFDISICRFATDGEALHAGPHAWDDLVRGRFRVEQRLATPDASWRRLRRYVRRGYRPYRTAAPRLALTAVLFYGHVVPRHALRVIRRRLASLAP